MEYTLTSKQWRHAFREGKFLGLKCKQCGAYTVPPQKVCSQCQSEDMEVTELCRNGEVQTFTLTQVPAEGFEAPYIVALVKLDEGPWITTNIINVDPKKANMGIIGRKGKVGYKEVPADKFSGGERIAMTFSVE
ncbi:MAG: Zn-ribbon domain-containing OB-fold protein [Chloroflexota bacterium]